MSQGSALHDWSDEAAGSPEDHYARRCLRRRVNGALAALSDQERSVFLLVEFEGLSRHEAAYLLGAAEGTIASRLARARSKFESVMREERQMAHGTVSARPTPYLSQTVGNVRFETNAWGHDKTKDWFEQRFIDRRADGVRQLGWYWYWPGYDRSVFSYPEALIGWKPWSGGVSTDHRLPASIVAARELVVGYAVELRATGTYNLAVSTWLSGSPTCSLAPDTASISTEVMVWPDYSPGATPPGRFVAPVRIDGQEYELWRALGHGKNYKGDEKGWNVLTLRGAGGCQRGLLPLGEVLATLASNGLVAQDDYVTCVELGNEVMGGAGTTFVEHFAIEI